LGYTPGGGGVLSTPVRPVEERAPAAGEAQLLGLTVHDTGASPKSAATNRTLPILGSNPPLERNLSLDWMVPFGPAADIRRALRGPLLSDLWIDVRSLGCRGFRGEPRPSNSLTPRW